MLVSYYSLPAGARFYRVPFLLNHNSEKPLYRPIILFHLHNPKHCCKHNLERYKPPLVLSRNFESIAYPDQFFFNCLFYFNHNSEKPLYRPIIRFHLHNPKHCYKHNLERYKPNRPLQDYCEHN